MKNILKILYKVMFVVGMICSLYVVIDGMIQAVEAGKLYDKTEITAEDLIVESEYKTITTVEGSSYEDFYYKIRKLSGVEHVCQLKLEANESVKIACTSGDVKVLILDEQGQQCFFAAATEVVLEPEVAGKYEVYIIGKKYTGEVKLDHHI